MSAADPVAAVRRFNRFYTRAIGLLDRGYLGTSYTLSEGRVLYEIAKADGPNAKDIIEVREPSRKSARIIDSMGAVDRRGVPNWLELTKDAFKGTVKSLPTREDVTLPIREQLIVELYSK